MIFFNKPKSSKPEKSKPNPLFDAKKHWERKEFLRKAMMSSPRYQEFGRKVLPRHLEKKMLDQVLPSNRFGTHISEWELKKRLKELRGQEYRAKTSDEKKRLNRLRSYLEKETGLKGKY